MDRSPAFIPLTAAAATCGTTPARLRRWAGLLRVPLFHPDSSRETMLRERDLPRLLPILLPLATLARANRELPRGIMGSQGQRS